MGSDTQPCVPVRDGPARKPAQPNIGTRIKLRCSHVPLRRWRDRRAQQRANLQSGPSGWRSGCTAAAAGATRGDVRIPRCAARSSARALAGRRQAHPGECSGVMTRGARQSQAVLVPRMAGQHRHDNAEESGTTSRSTWCRSTPSFLRSTRKRNHRHTGCTHRRRSRSLRSTPDLFRSRTTRFRWCRRRSSR